MSKCLCVPLGMFRHFLFRGVLGVLLAASALVNTRCKYDDDTRYEVKPKYVLCLIQDTWGKAIYRFNSDIDTVFTNVSQQLSLPANITDMALDGSMLWLASPATNQVIVVDVVKLRINRTFDLNFAPHYLAVGDKSVFLSDTVAMQIGFLDKNASSTQLAVFQRDKRPGRPLHQSDRFFVPLNDSSLEMFNAQAIASEAVYPLVGRLVSMTVNNVFSINCLQLNGTVYGIRTLNPSTRQMSGFAQRDIDQIQSSPYLNIRFGTEWLQDVTSRKGKCNAPFVVEDVLHYDVDFRFGRILFQTTTGNFKLQDLRSGQILYYRFLNKPFIKAAFFSSDGF